MLTQNEFVKLWSEGALLCIEHSFEVEGVPLTSDVINAMDFSSVMTEPVFVYLVSGYMLGKNCSLKELTTYLEDFGDDLVIEATEKLLKDKYGV